jgi:hypothetical protein
VSFHGFYDIAESAPVDPVGDEVVGPADPATAFSLAFALLRGSRLTQYGLCLSHTRRPSR